MRAPGESRIVVRRRRTSFLATFLLASACAAPGGPPATIVESHDGSDFRIAERARVSAGARADFEGAVRLLEQQRDQDGIALLLKVTDEAPDATAAHIDLGIAYGRVGELEKAEASLERALQLNPRHPVAYNELGMIYRRMGRFHEARTSYEKALALQPGFHFAQRNLAILCDLYLADHACALEHYEAYTRAVPDDATAAMWVADLRARGDR